MADTGANPPMQAAQSRSLLEDIESTKAMIAAMPARRRRIFLMRVVEGCSLADIAERLDLSAASIENELAEAIEFCVTWDEAFERGRKR